MVEGSYPQFFRRSLSRRWAVIVLALLLGLGAGALLVTTSTTDYRATSVVFLEPLVGNPYSPTTPSGRQEELAALTTEAGLLLADSVSESAEESAHGAGIDLGPQLQERTSTEVPSNSQVINVSFTATSPEVARFGAQALATSYLEYRASRSQEVMSAQLARIDQEISSLTALVDAASEELVAAGSADADAISVEVSNLEEQVRIYANQLAQLRIERVNVEGTTGSPGEIVSPARLPTQPEGLPAPLLAVAIALVFLGAGIVIAVVLEHLDTHLRSPDEIERLGLHPVYGLAPLWKPELIGSDAEDAYRLAAISAQGGVCAVLGASGPVPPGVAAGLAHALAENGHSVIILVCAPLTEGSTQASGLSDVLQESSTSPMPASVQARPGIHVMGAGRQPQDLPSLLQGPHFPLVVDRLAHDCDTLLLIGAETVSASGAALCHVSDSTLLVSIAGQTREADLIASARMIEESDGQLGGVFLSTKPRKKDRQNPQSTSSDHGPLAVLLAADHADDLTERPSSATPRHRPDRDAV